MCTTLKRVGIGGFTFYFSKIVLTKQLKLKECDLECNDGAKNDKEYKDTKILKCKKVKKKSRE